MVIGPVVAKIVRKTKPKFKLKATGKALADKKTASAVKKRANTIARKRNAVKKQKDMERKQRRAEAKKVTKKKEISKKITNATTAKPQVKKASSPRMRKALAKHKTAVAGTMAAGTLGYLAHDTYKKRTHKKKVEEKKPLANSTTVKEVKKPSISFGNAFASARKAGKKQFTWNGKKYHTRTKEEESVHKKKKTVKVTPSKTISKPKTASKKKQYSDQPDLRQQQAGPKPTRKKKVIYSGT